MHQHFHHLLLEVGVSDREEVEHLDRAAAHLADEEFVLLVHGDQHASLSGPQIADPGGVLRELRNRIQGVAVFAYADEDRMGVAGVVFLQRLLNSPVDV